MTVIQVAYVVRELDGRRIFLDSKGCRLSQTVNHDAATRRVLKLQESFVVTVGTDIRLRQTPRGVGVHTPVLLVVP